MDFGFWGLGFYFFGFWFCWVWGIGGVWGLELGYAGGGGSAEHDGVVFLGEGWGREGVDVSYVSVVEESDVVHSVSVGF